MFTQSEEVFWWLIQNYTAQPIAVASTLLFQYIGGREVREWEIFSSASGMHEWHSKQPKAVYACASGNLIKGNRRAISEFQIKLSSYFKTQSYIQFWTLKDPYFSQSLTDPAFGWFLVLRLKSLEFMPGVIVSLIFTIIYATKLRGLEHGLRYSAECSQVLRRWSQLLWKLFTTSNLLTNLSHSSPLPPLKSATINFNKWKIHYSLLPAKLLGIFACTMQMHTEKKWKWTSLMVKKVKVRRKRQMNFSRFFLCVCM